MTTINIRGMIVKDSQKEAYEKANIQTTSVSEILNKLTPGQDVELIINSIGGDVFAGNEIFTALKSHDGHVKAKIIFAASIATVVAMAADDALMSPTGQFMIHNVSTTVDGDYRNMEKVAEVLKTMNASVIAAYKAKTNRNESEISAMMDKETWLNAEKAKELGFIDGIMFEDTKELSFVACMTQKASEFDFVAERKRDVSFVAKGDFETFKNEILNIIKTKENNFKGVTISLDGKKIAEAITNKSGFYL